MIIMKSVVHSFVPALALGVVAIAAVGCNRDRVDRDRTVTPLPGDRTVTPLPGDRPGTTNDGTGTTTVTGANVGSVGNQAAVGRIVAARCARETTCNNVGLDKHWANGPACTAKVTADMKDDLNANDCPYGVDEKELNECLAAIRGESCNNPIETISRLAACRTSDMCLKTAAPNR